MAAQYPSNARSFTARVDRVDINAAQDINALQEEVTATQTAVGRNPAVSARYPSATTVADRVTQFEDDVLPRLLSVEQRLRRAAVAAKRAATLQFNSSPLWQNFVMPDVESSLNDFGTATQLYDPALGRFYSVAPAPALWSLSATITWEAATSPVGIRGLALVTSGGTVLSLHETPAVAGEETTLSISWTGRLPVDPTYYVSLSVKQTQGTALNVRGDTATTPCRVDFVHIPG